MNSCSKYVPVAVEPEVDARPEVPIDNLGIGCYVGDPFLRILAGEIVVDTRLTARAFNILEAAIGINKIFRKREALEVLCFG